MNGPMPMWYPWQGVQTGGGDATLAKQEEILAALAAGGTGVWTEAEKQQVLDALQEVKEQTDQTSLCG